MEGSVREKQGTGFVHIKDPDEMRVVLFWELDVLDEWSRVFASWSAKPLTLRTRGRQGRRVEAYRGKRAAYFHPEVADRLLGRGRDTASNEPLGADNRRSLALPEYVEYGDAQGALLQVGALEVLRVTGDGPPRARPPPGPRRRPPAELPAAPRSRRRSGQEIGYR